MQQLDQGVTGRNRLSTAPGPGSGGVPVRQDRDGAPFTPMQASASAEHRLLQVLPGFVSHLKPTIAAAVTQELLRDADNVMADPSQLPSKVSDAILRLLAPPGSSREPIRRSTAPSQPATAPALGRTHPAMLNRQFIRAPGGPSGVSSASSALNSPLPPLRPPTETINMTSSSCGSSMRASASKSGSVGLGAVHDTAAAQAYQNRGGSWNTQGRTGKAPHQQPHTWSGITRTPHQQPHTWSGITRTGSTGTPMAPIPAASVPSAGPTSASTSMTQPASPMSFTDGSLLLEASTGTVSVSNAPSWDLDSAHPSPTVASPQEERRRTSSAGGSGGSGYTALDEERGSDHSTIGELPPQFDRGSLASSSIYTAARSGTSLSDMSITFSDRPSAASLASDRSAVPDRNSGASSAALFTQMSWDSQSVSSRASGTSTVHGSASSLPLRRQGGKTDQKTNLPVPARLASQTGPAPLSWEQLSKSGKIIVMGQPLTASGRMGSMGPGSGENSLPSSSSSTVGVLGKQSNRTGFEDESECSTSQQSPACMPTVGAEPPKLVELPVCSTSSSSELSPAQPGTPTMLPFPPMAPKGTTSTEAAAAAAGCAVGFVAPGGEVRATEPLYTVGQALHTPSDTALQEFSAARLPSKGHITTQEVSLLRVVTTGQNPQQTQGEVLKDSSEEEEEDEEENPDEDVGTAVHLLLRKHYPQLAPALHPVLEAMCSDAEMLRLAAAAKTSQPKSLEVAACNAVQKLLNENRLLKERIQSMEAQTARTSAPTISSAGTSSGGGAAAAPMLGRESLVGFASRSKDWSSAKRIAAAAALGGAQGSNSPSHRSDSGVPTTSSSISLSVLLTSKLEASGTGLNSNLEVGSARSSEAGTELTFARRSSNVSLAGTAHTSSDNGPHSGTTDLTHAASLLQSASSDSSRRSRSGNTSNSSSGRQSILGTQDDISHITPLQEGVDSPPNSQGGTGSPTTSGDSNSGSSTNLSTTTHAADVSSVRQTPRPQPRVFVETSVSGRMLRSPQQLVGIPEMDSPATTVYEGVMERVSEPEAIPESVAAQAGDFVSSSDSVDQPDALKPAKRASTRSKNTRSRGGRLQEWFSCFHPSHQPQKLDGFE